MYASPLLNSLLTKLAQFSIVVSQWVKNPLCNAGDTGDSSSIPGSGKILLEEGMATSFHSYLENPMDRVYKVAKCQTQLNRLSTHTFVFQHLFKVQV